MRPRKRPLAKALFFLAAAPATWAAALRVARLGCTLPFDELVVELRRPLRRLPARLAANPVWLAGTAEVLLPVLPPRRHGPCLRRALVVLELWSRCGLRPDLHLGVRPAPDLREAHAWVTARSHGGAELRASAPGEYVEAWVL